MAALAASLALVACGGSDGSATDDPADPVACDLAAQMDGLRAYMRDWYFWAGIAPDPDPAGHATLAAYFNALRFAGTATVPADRWSYLQDTASYTRFYAEGRTMGHGLAVNGVERQLPLRIRRVEPDSPAARAGLRRGDIVLSANGRSAADMVAADDFGVFSPSEEGETLTLVIERDGVQSMVSVTSAIYDLTPVPTARVIEIGNGAKAGYVMLDQFITQAEAPLAAALADFRAAGATELIVDLRYNGGGRVSTANALASLIVGAQHAGGLFTQLRYNAAHQASNTTFTLASAPAPAFGRVVVLTGPRTCSASELVVNGLRPWAQVVTIGGATCGKPFGFNPVSSCGTTVNAVNFQAFNAAGEGDYYDGIAPTCAAADEFTGAFGDPAEALTAAAASYLADGHCAAAGAAGTGRERALSARARRGIEPGERPGMFVD